jgi:hypothetical protein
MIRDPLAGLHTIDTSGLPDLDEISAECHQLDDIPDFSAEDTEVDPHIRLSADRSIIHTPARRLFVDYRSNPDAYRHIDPLPAEGESLHGIISGKYALWELVPAIIERTGQKIIDLHISTLSFSKQNAADLLALLDDGHIKKVGLLISYFFKAQNAAIYGSLIPPLRERGHKVLAMRTHAKLLLFKMADGTCYTVESSANLRSSVNAELFVLTRGESLYQFHHSWVEGELLHGIELGKDDSIKQTDPA